MKREQMTAIRTERELVGVALALIGGDANLSADEQRIADGNSYRPSRKLVAATRAAIALGGDPLGEALMRQRAPALRRQTGAVYTPSVIIASMLAWAESEGSPARVIDPGSGSGRFLVAAGRRFPKAQLLAVEIDPVAALLTRANLSACGLTHRAAVIVGDYRETLPAPTSGRTLFIGNPPYVRHHAISPDWKRWYTRAAASFGIRASTLAGLHLHFFLRTLQIARNGDFGTFVTAAEWLDVNYGAALRRLLDERLGGVALHVLEPGAMPFADTLVTGAITCFRVGRRPASLQMRSVPNVEALNGLSAGTPVPWKELRNARRWSVMVRPAPAPPAGFIELGELCRVSRGQVTGGNSVWIAGDQARHLPHKVLKPTVTKARELLAAGENLTESGHLKRVIDLPVDLDEFDPPERQAIERFLEWAKHRGAADSYIAKHRRAWWAVLLYEPAPIICTYMARRPPAFVRNLCGAHHLNIAHGLYPREPLSDRCLTQLAAYLRRNVSTAAGRTYAGGLTKFEPSEIERLHIPTPAELAGSAIA